MSEKDVVFEKGESFGWGVVAAALSGGALRLTLRHVSIPKGLFAQVVRNAPTDHLLFLHIAWTQLSLQDIEALCSVKWPSLKELSLNDSGIDTRALEPIFDRGAFPSLISLDLEDNPIDEVALQAKMKPRPDLFVNFAWWNGQPEFPRKTWAETSAELEPYLERLKA